MPAINLPIEGGSHVAANPAGRSWFNDNPQLLFDDTITESHRWNLRIPSAASVSGFVAKLQFKMATAATGNIEFAVQLMAHTPDGGVSLNVNSFDTANSSGAVVVAAVLGDTIEVSVPLTNDDGIQPGDWLAIHIARLVSVGGNAAGDLQLVAGTIEYTST